MGPPSIGGDVNESCAVDIETTPGPKVREGVPSILRDVPDAPAIRYAKSGDVNIAYRVVGEGPVDLIVNVDQGRAIAAAIPGARFVELSGENHVPFLGDPDAIVDEIEEFLTGVRSLPQRDRVLATVLFTDIVGSTEAAAAHGDRRWRALLDEHDRLVEEQVTRFHGRKVKATGDGVLALFDGPGRAVHCACAIREGVRSIGPEIRSG
jgi:hypothetical protein